jgi:hypothetical protein
MRRSIDLGQPGRLWVSGMANECHARLTKRDVFDVRFNSSPPSATKHSFARFPWAPFGLQAVGYDHRSLPCLIALRAIQSQGVYCLCPSLGYGLPLRIIRPSRLVVSVAITFINHGFYAPGVPLSLFAPWLNFLN